jgi:hypothetical protein
MIVVVKCLLVRIYQYFPILNDHCQRIQFREDIWQTLNLDKYIIAFYLTNKLRPFV